MQHYRKKNVDLKLNVMVERMPVFTFLNNYIINFSPEGQITHV